MQCINKTGFLLAMLILAACATERAVPLPDNSAPVPAAPPRSSARRPAATAPSVPLQEPEQGLRTAIEAYRAGNTRSVIAAASALAERYPGSAWYKRALFVTEQSFIQADLADEADAAMLRVRAEYPEMADYALSLLADYHFAGKRFSRAAALYQDVVDGYPKSSLAVRASFRRGQALLEAFAFSPAADLLEAFLRNNSRSEFAPDAGLALGQALLADNRVDDAVRTYREVWVKYPGTSADQDALAVLTMLSRSAIEVPAWSGEELYERGRNLFRALQYDKAVDAFGKLLEQEPKTAHRAEALFRIGVSHFYLGKRGEAAVVLERMAADYPRDERAAEALYWIGKCYSKLGDRERAVKTFQKLLSRHPESEWADDSLFIIGNVYREAGDLKKALTFYGRLAIDYPDSKFADSALWWMAWQLYISGEYRKADQKLQDLINRYPRSFLVHQARYWQGRIAERTGDPDKAASQYARVLKQGSFTYYGYRAAERLAQSGAGASPPAEEPGVDAGPACGETPCPEDPLSSYETDDGPPVWTEETRQLLTGQPSFRKTLELMHLEMKKEAAAELWYLQDRLPRKRGALIGLSKAFFELGDYHRSLLLVLRNYERYLEGEVRATPADLWLLAYPQGYWDSILAYSRKYGQDPYFIAAIIREESQFHAEALSPAGARGVMQVMPATGEWIAQTIKLPSFDRSRLFESDTAINLGTWYISHLMKKFRNDPLLVAAAYNAGPEAVAGWMDKNGRSRDRDEFVESIPYAETRGYVKKVLRNYSEYRRIYGKAAPGSLRQAAPLIGTMGSLIADETVKTP